jgi:hypothetical protein
MLLQQIILRLVLDAVYINKITAIEAFRFMVDTTRVPVDKQRPTASNW